MRPRIGGRSGKTTLLHIDDDESYRQILGRHLNQAGFDVVAVGTGAEGMNMAQEGPNLILLDHRLPDCDGQDLCRRFKADPKTASIPVLSLSNTLHSGRERALALSSGASAALSKSCDPEELTAIVSALIRANRGEMELVRARREMERRLREQAAEMEHVWDQTIEGWARALELRDHETEGHSRRVAELTMRVARRMGMSEAELVHVWRGALLHDIGKVGVPDAILNKPGPLDDEEWQVMRRHPELARRMLEPINFLGPVLAIPCSHHERWDGSGYPERLRGEEIPRSARVFAAVDIYDARAMNGPTARRGPRAESEIILDPFPTAISNRA